MCHSNGLHLLSFTCKRDPYQGRSGSWMLLPFVLFKDCHIRISAYYCLFLQGVSQHFGCLLMVDSQPCPIWTPWGLVWFSRTFCLMGPQLSSQPPPYYRSIVLRDCIWSYINIQSHPPDSCHNLPLARGSVPLTWCRLARCIL